ncbi:hypothetical protein NDU88_004452 [Pleurodeles waltl]|uniref:Endonuclease/exonuclease/phosphatase domain-containing protein n=1 Tax=Pleurodeles waltl TaxID=8319 RepID=A0AAV7W512_PLEWA|nr:hypothetical protein NDU88_004452 [Pleurodeles waltl]
MGRPVACGQRRSRMELATEMWCAGPADPHLPAEQRGRRRRTAPWSVGSLQRATLRDLGAMLLDFPPGLLLLGGDMNLVSDPGLDSLSRARGPAATMALQSFKGSFGLTDLWRAQNLRKRQYTYTSVPH